MSLNSRFDGRIEVICGSMFSGKTEELINRIKKAEIAGIDYIVFKPQIDSRNPENKIISHAKNEISVTSILDVKDIFKKGKGYSIVGIDEAQFFDDSIVEICNSLAYNGCRVIIAGLDMDFKGNPFGPMPYLMATAEYVTKVHAICTKTGNLAQYSYRKAKSDDLVLLGEVDEYEPLSRAAYYKSMLRDKVRQMNVNDAQEINSKQQKPDA